LGENLFRDRAAITAESQLIDGNTNKRKETR
jgi:hypothetical protein